MTDTSDQQFETMIQNLEERTGKSIDEWIAIAHASGLEKHKAIIDHLKTFGLTYGYANLVAHRAREASSGGTPTKRGLVEAMFCGEKAALRPLYDSLIEAISGFGTDVEIAPKRTYVSLRRRKQFGLVQPTTRSRLDVGINLPDVKPHGRLEAYGSFNSMVSHRVRLEASAEIDPELISWLRSAYESS